MILKGEVMTLTQVPVGKKVKHEGEFWEIIFVDHCDSKVQLMNEIYHETKWVKLSDLKI